MNNLVIQRRQFLRLLGRYSLAAGGAGLLLSSLQWMQWLLGGKDAIAGDKLDAILKKAPVARYWVSTSSSGASCDDCHAPNTIRIKSQHSHSKEIIRCQLCAQGCFISEGERGRCGTRVNVNGKLRTLVYGRPISIHVDPIEKKPFYHYLPGAAAFSMATSGCPLSCQFCQNWEISQSRPEDYPSRFTSPALIVDSAVSRKAPVIAFTYNEPTVFTEYLLDIAEAGLDEGIRSVLISCGFMQEAPLHDMCGVLDAIKIDLKGFSDDFYRKVCGARLDPVLRSIKQVAQSKVHLEIVNLVVPTLNDSEPMLRALCEWLFNEVGPDVPVHFTRFHPDYKLLNLSPTPVKTLELAREIAFDSGIHYPFVGNVPGHSGNHTLCPSCKKMVVGRSGFFVTEMHIRDNRCEYCGETIAGVWS